ncbi:MAG: hypothetical protein IJ593_11515 [Lachnospiraceae bacterium]|nr:hypothetical protein [Lachnospiraceae bacterium]
MLIKYINITTDFVCEDKTTDKVESCAAAITNIEPYAAVITNKAELDKMAENKQNELNNNESDKLNICTLAIKKLKINEIITKEVEEAYKDEDVLKKLNYITLFNKKIKYDENGVATNLADVISEIMAKGEKNNG